MQSGRIHSKTLQDDRGVGRRPRYGLVVGMGGGRQRGRSWCGDMGHRARLVYCLLNIIDPHHKITIKVLSCQQPVPKTHISASQVPATPPMGKGGGGEGEGGGRRPPQAPAAPRPPREGPRRGNFFLL